MTNSQTPAPRRTRLLPKLIALAISCLFAFVLVEVLVRVAIPVRNVGPAFSEFDPVYGKRLKRNYTCTRITPEFTMRLTTNSLGYRGPEPGNSGRRPILFIGDSFTLGFGVDDGREFPALVRKELADRFGPGEIPVYNAGIGNLGTGRWVRFLRKEGPAINPRCVVLQVCVNDFADNVREKTFRLADDGSLVESDHVPEPGLARQAQRVIEAIPGLSYSHVVALAAQVVTAPRGQPEAAGSGPLSVPAPATPPAPAPPADRLTYRLLEEVASICRANGWPLLAVIVGDVDPRIPRVREVFEAQGVPCIVIPSKHERPDLYFRVDGHWIEAGHAFTAARVSEWLLSMPPLWQDLGEKSGTPSTGK